MEIFPDISMDPNIRFGKPCLTGTRIDVATVVGALAACESFDAVQEAYSLTNEQFWLRSGMPRMLPSMFHRRLNRPLENQMRETLPLFVRLAEGGVWWTIWEDEL